MFVPRWLAARDFLMVFGRACKCLFWGKKSGKSALAPALETVIKKDFKKSLLLVLFFFRHRGRLRVN